MTPQTLQAMLTRAEREGWITRDISEVNHRILTASLTRKGEAALATRPRRRGRDRREDLEPESRAHTLDQLNATLEHGIANLRGEITSHRAAS